MLIGSKFLKKNKCGNKKYLPSYFFDELLPIILVESEQKKVHVLLFLDIVSIVQ